MAETPLEPRQLQLLQEMLQSLDAMPEGGERYLLLNWTDGFLTSRDSSFTRRNVREDVEELERVGLVAMTGRAGITGRVTVRPQARAFLRDHRVPPLSQLELAPIGYLQTATFQRRYPQVYEQWAEAREALSDSTEERVKGDVGMACREAMILFAQALAERFVLAERLEDREKDVWRIRAALGYVREKMGEKERAFLDGLISYWEGVTGLVQRQRHARGKQGAPVSLEDAQRLVLHSAVVMYEVDQAIARAVRKSPDRSGG
jgi:hypothetical protein